VVYAVGRVGPVVPTRLATVYRDDARIGTVLADRRADFSAVLDRVTDRTEWGVKVYAAPAPPRPAAAPAPDTTGPGAAYLRRRREQLSAEHQTQQAAVDDAQEVHAALSRCAEAVRRHPPQDRRLTGQAAAMLLNGAYLVGTEHSQQFGATVAALSGRYRTIRLELTGPWPPYSFSTVEFSTVEDFGVVEHSIRRDDVRPAAGSNGPGRAGPGRPGRPARPGPRHRRGDHG